MSKYRLFRYKLENQLNNEAEFDPKTIEFILKLIDESMGTSRIKKLINRYYSNFDQVGSKNFHKNYQFFLEDLNNKFQENTECDQDTIKLIISAFNNSIHQMKFENLILHPP